MVSPETEPEARPEKTYSEKQAELINDQLAELMSEPVERLEEYRTTLAQRVEELNTSLGQKNQQLDQALENCRTHIEIAKLVAEARQKEMCLRDAERQLVCVIAILERRKEASG